MPTNSEVCRLPPRQPPALDPNLDYVTEWTLAGADHGPADRNPDHLDNNPDLSATTQLGAE